MTQQQYDALQETINNQNDVEQLQRMQSSLTLDYHLRYQLMQNKINQLWQKEATNAEAETENALKTTSK